MIDEINGKLCVKTRCELLMDKMKRICGWITAALIGVMAILLIVSCVSIYSSGSRPFTREVIAQYAGRIAVIGLLCLLAVTVGLFIPNTADKTKAIRNQKALLARYCADLPAARKEQKLRRNYRLAAAVISAVLAVYPLLYLFDAVHFSVADVNGDVLHAALVVLIPTAVVMVVVLLFQHLEQSSITREMESYKTNGIKPGKAPEKKAADPQKRTVIRAALLVAGMILVIIGAANGGAADVLGKAIRICTECIGLG